MAFGDVLRKKEEILSQYRVLGVPTEEELKISENVIHVNSYTREDGTEVEAHYRSKPDGIESNNLSFNTSAQSGTPTGGAAKVYRESEPVDIKYLPKNNDDFFNKERNNPQSILMRVNNEKNVDRPDAKLFMDIALVGPKNVPSTQDYQFVSSEHNKEINEKYNLTGNKEIPRHYDGFKFSANSPTANALNNSEEFRKQILCDKNYDLVTGSFKTDKLEIEFKDDKNLQYSFGHMTVINPKIENGYIIGFGYDKYDYEAMYGKKFANVSKETKSLNNKAKFLQSTSKLKNYYVLVPVKVKI